MENQSTLKSTFRLNSLGKSYGMNHLHIMVLETDFYKV